MDNSRDSRGRFRKGTCPNPAGRAGRGAKGAVGNLRDAVLSKLAGRQEQIAESILRRAQAGEPGSMALLTRLLEMSEQQPELSRHSRQDLRRLSVAELALLHAIVMRAEGRELSSTDQALLDAATAATTQTRAIPATDARPVPAASEALGDPAAETERGEPVPETERTSDVAATEPADSVWDRAAAFAEVEPGEAEREAADEEPTDAQASDGRIVRIDWSRGWSHE